MILKIPNSYGFKILVIMTFLGSSCSAELTELSSKQAPPIMVANPPPCVKEQSVLELKEINEKLLKEIQNKEVYTSQIQDSFSVALQKYQQHLSAEKSQKDRQCLLAFLYVLSQRAEGMALEEIMADWYNDSSLPRKDKLIFTEDLKQISGKKEGPEFSKKVISNLKSYLEQESDY